MGVSDCFCRLYGPDLIETLKEGPAYYERIFADLGIAAADALVVDDSPRTIEWATQVGACTVLVGNSSLPQTGTTVAKTRNYPNITRYSARAFLVETLKEQKASS